MAGHWHRRKGRHGGGSDEKGKETDEWKMNEGKNRSGTQTAIRADKGYVNICVYIYPWLAGGLVTNLGEVSV